MIAVSIPGIPSTCVILSGAFLGPRSHMRAIGVGGVEGPAFAGRVVQHELTAPSASLNTCHSERSVFGAPIAHARDWGRRSRRTCIAGRVVQHELTAPPPPTARAYTMPQLNQSTSDCSA
jgi:hypothetical protein